MLGLNGLKLDGDLLAGDDVGSWKGMLVARRCADVLLHSLTKVDVTETAASDLAADAVLVTDSEILCCIKY